jgi:alpha/beta superfamily hydrolase
MVELRSTTVLPAIREDIELRTDDGLILVGELALPVSGRIDATLVTLHPLPTHGGFMDSHLLRKAAWRLPYLADVAVLRFNTRGTHSPRGTSEGSHEGGAGEGLDARAAVAFASERGLPRRWLLGWSFGTEIALRHGSSLDVEGAILLSPPMQIATAADLAAWRASGKPVLALIPEHDDYLPPDQARAAFAALPSTELVPVAGARHLWVGERYVRIALDTIVARIAPSHSPLPTQVPESAVWHRHAPEEVSE